MSSHLIPISLKRLSVFTNALSNTILCACKSRVSVSGSHHEPPADGLRSYMMTSWFVDLRSSQAIDMPVGPVPTMWTRIYNRVPKILRRKIQHVPRELIENHETHRQNGLEIEVRHGCE